MRTLWKTLLVLAAIAIAACGSPAQPGLRIAGSTSVQPLAEMLAEAYGRAGGGRVSIQGGGSTAGVQAVLSGVADLGAVSRDLTPAELQQGLVANLIGYDVLTVIVHPTNPVKRLTREQLRAVFGGRIRDWAEVGGSAGPIHLISRESGSGSREAFRHLVGPVSDRAIIQNSSGAIRVAVMDDPGAVGYVSLGVARSGGVKSLRVDGQLPGAAQYPLMRSLSLVTRGGPRGESLAFIQFARSPAGHRLIQEEGLVPAKNGSIRR